MTTLAIFSITGIYKSVTNYWEKNKKISELNKLWHKILIYLHQK